MTGRRIRNWLLLAVLAGAGYWIYSDRPTISGIVDTLTSPLMGSKAAVNTSERKRLVGDASKTLSEESEVPVASLQVGMTRDEVRRLLGAPDRAETATRNGVEEIRWTFDKADRIVIFQRERVVSIIVR